jgi:signal peptidase II
MQEKTGMTNDKKINRHDGLLAWVIVIAILIIDQVIKIEVKTTMSLGESIRVTDWFYINFIENNGMAWGMTFINKLFLSVLSIIAVTAIGWFIYQVVRQKGRRRFVVVLSMIAAGAAGNIFDSMFYGLIFSASSPYYVSYFVPFGTGYASFLMGKVVDMFYFPLIVSTWPDWMPFVGGEHFVFFSPVFNFADACITVGVLLMLILCRKDMETMGDVIRTGLGRATKTDNNEHACDSGKKDLRQKKDISQRKEESR